MGIQRYNGRGKTVLGKWGNGRRYLGRDELGIQRYNGRGETGLGKWGNGNIHFNFFVDISFLLRRLVQLQCGKKLLDCSNSGRRILVTQVPKIGYAFKLPNSDNKKKKISKVSHSHKETNKIYLSMHNCMRQSPQTNESSDNCSTQTVWSGRVFLM